MQRFAHAHATHPQWAMAAALVVAQLRAQLETRPAQTDIALGFVYFTDPYAADANDLLSYLHQALPFVRRWVVRVMSRQWMAV